MDHIASTRRQGCAEFIILPIWYNLLHVELISQHESTFVRGVSINWTYFSSWIRGYGSLKRLLNY